MRFHVLGPVAVHVGGRALKLGGRKPRALLALLLAAGGSTVSADRLIDQIWSGAPPPEAMASLQAYIARLRRVLEPDRSARAPAQLLVTRAPGYRLIVGARQVDAGEFQDLVTAGQRTVPTDPATAIRHFDKALGLWHGTPYQDVAEICPDLAVEATRLEEIRLVATEDRWDAAIRLGEHAGLVGELEAIVTAHPTRERSWGLLALALYRSQRQADALEAIRRARRLLSDELGLDPGPELRRLEERMLNHDPDLTAPAARGAPPVSIGTDSRSDQRSTQLGSEVAGALVGRDDELAKLDAVLAAAHRGTGRVVIVSGEPGIGKTRIAEAATAAATAQGFATGWGRCDEEGSLRPLWPWTQALRDLLPPAGDLGRGAEAADQRAALAAVLPELAPPSGTSPTGRGPSTDDADSAAFRLADAMATLLSSLAAGTPALIVLDDLHWADADSLLLLRRLAPAIRSWPVITMVTMRDAEADIGPAMAATLATLARLDPVRVRPTRLRAADIAAYLREYHDLEPDDATVAAIHTRTEGNPFYVVELTRLLADEGKLDDSTAPGELVVPDGVRDVVRRRLAQLPDQVTVFLRAAATAGQDFDVAVVEAASGLDSDDALGALETALLAGLVTTDGPPSERYRFAHALVRDAVYERTSVPQRLRLHAATAATIERLHAGNLETRAAELAHHYAHAGPSHASAAWRYAVRAAERADSLPAYGEAARMYALAAQTSVHDPDISASERHDLLVRLGWADARTGDIRGAWNALADAAESALANGRAVDAAKAAVAISVDSVWNWRAYHEVDARAIAIFERLLQAIPDAEPALRGQAELALALEIYYRDDGRVGLDLAEAGLDRIRRHASRRTLLQALAVLVAVNQLPDRLDRRLVATREMVALSDEDGDPLERARAYCLHGCTLLEQGHFSEALADLARARTSAMEHRLVPLLVVLGWSETIVTIARGQFGAGERMLERTTALHASTTMAGANDLPYVIGFCLRLLQGRLPELEPDLHAWADHTGLAAARDMHALALSHAGRLDEARELLGAWRRQPPLTADFLWLPASALRAELWANLGDADAAHDLRRQLEPYADRMAFGGTGVALLGAVSHYLGKLARVGDDHDDAADLLRAALARHEADGLVPFAARSAAELARTLRERGRPGDHREATGLADRAAGLARSISMTLPSL